MNVTIDEIEATVRWMARILHRIHAFRKRVAGTPPEEIAEVN